MDGLELLNRTLEVVQSAGGGLAKEWERPGGPRGAGDKAEVDSEIEAQLRDELLALLNCDFWGEETGHRITGAEYCWVVDPNDGTYDFLQGHPGSAVSVGLLRNSVPVLGAVYAPVTDKGPDCISWVAGLKGIMRNNQIINNRLDDQVLEVGCKVMMSMAAHNKLEANAILCAPAAVVPMPSIAYRLARVAAGDAIACASLVPVSAHDIVAGHALLIGAGGGLLDQLGEGIRYDSMDRLLRPSLRCFGGAPQACKALVARDWDRLFRST